MLLHTWLHGLRRGSVRGCKLCNGRPENLFCVVCISICVSGCASGCVSGCVYASGCASGCARGGWVLIASILIGVSLNLRCTVSVVGTEAVMGDG